MRPYEAMVIFDADLDEETIRAAVTRFLDLVKNLDGEAGAVDHWGRRRMAYEMKRRTEAYYVVLQFRAEPASLDEFNRTVSLSDSVIRHRTIVIPEGQWGKTRPEAPTPVSE